MGRVCLALAATFALALTPLAVGFALSSLGAREELLNGVGNLLGMLMTFLGGAWMPLSLMGSAVQTVAHFVPTYWVNACRAGRHRLRPGRHGTLCRGHRRRRPRTLAHQIPRLV